MNCFDHILPKSAGGNDEIENIQAVCIECHYLKTTTEKEEGCYFNMPNYCSTFNKITYDIVSSEPNRFIDGHLLKVSIAHHI